jgi:hypothetical protein
MWHEYNNIPFWISTTNVFSKSKIFKFLKRDWGTIPVAERDWGTIPVAEKRLGYYSCCSISYKCASKQAMKIWFSVGSKAKASDFDFQSCLLCANPIWQIFQFLSILTLLISKAMLRLFTD